MIQIFSRFIKFQLPTSFLMKNVAAVNVLAKKVLLCIFHGLADKNNTLNQK